MKSSRSLAWLLSFFFVPLLSGDAQTESDHWAFQPIAPQGRPSRNLTSHGEPIDVFFTAKYTESGLVPQPRENPDLLLRRVFLDLTGVPPSTEERKAFLQDPSDVHYERVVERLLASPAYGERWGRHWMDIWRYSDWYGLEGQLRNSQRHLWHWRDWIVNSLNRDKGYDRMIVEMLAGDELAPEDPEAVAATGFLARNYYLFNRTTWLDSTIEHTNRAFLGLTMQCAKCHTHKYDPITHEDYYRMRAVFEPHQVRLDQQPGEPDLLKDGLPRVFDAHLEEPTYRHRRGVEQDPDKSNPITPGIPKVFGTLEITPVSLPVGAFAPGTRPQIQNDHIKAAEARLSEVRDELNKASSAEERMLVEMKIQAASADLESIRARAGADTAQYLQPQNAESASVHAAEREWSAAIVQQEVERLEAEAEITRWRNSDEEGAQEKAKQAEERHANQLNTLTALKEQGPQSHHTPLPGSQKALETPAHTDADDPKVYPNQSTGRRLALARWIANRENPLTARVAVNHVWMRLAGESFVNDVTDFGERCEPPRHQDVLDHLASEFMDSGWSLKSLIRSIVTSETYQRTSSDEGADPHTISLDSENHDYWRMNAKRMQAPVIRDSVRSLAQSLDTAVGGPPIDPIKASTSPRRSLYFTHSLDDRHRFLEAFDNALVDECYRREESVTPQQALALTNDGEVQRMSLNLANATSHMCDSEFIKAAFQSILSREPSHEESDVCLEALTSINEEGSGDPTRSRSLVLLALFNHNDFITIR